MTSQAIRRSIDKAKLALSILKPKPPVHIVLRAKPHSSDSEAVKAAHLVEMAQLEANGTKVILLVGIKKLPSMLPRRRPSQASN